MTKFADFDVLVRGEAEETIVPLLDALDSGKELSAIPGISYRDGSRVCRSTVDAGIMDVDRLRMAAFHSYPISELRLRSMRVEAGRGCPFHWTFLLYSYVFREEIQGEGSSETCQRAKMPATRLQHH